ncbi:MAG: VacJ family lipoprotein [Desulforegulaceae bacterium]|nr:VacJ family lipoprotein [Desulforegulaceae bacterium]
MKSFFYFLLLFSFFIFSSSSFGEQIMDASMDIEDSFFEEIESDYNDFSPGFSDEELLDDDLFEDSFVKSSQSPTLVKKDYDPIEPVNRAIFNFNDKTYIYVFTPIGKGYEKVTPRFARTGIRNFFSNLHSPLRVVNSLLQGKIKNAGKETGKFFVNTFLGFLGFIDSASSIEGLNPSEEDLGQTLGKWGIGNGPYLVLPFIGPSTLRDTIGMTGEFYINPVYYARDFNSKEKLIRDGTEALNSLPNSMELYKTLKDSALDPYTAAKNAYIQIRDEKVKN